MMGPGGAALETVVWIIVGTAALCAIACLVLYVRDRRAARSDG